jgi:arylsulfatase A-like enzyme
MPFSHVHTTEADQPEKQYCGCEHKDQTRRGAFGDALAEADAIVGRIMAAIDASGVRSNTLVLFTGDNGPWLAQGTSGGSPGLLSGTYSGYW